MPEFEEREAAVYVHVTWQDWLHTMNGVDRAHAVAHYRAQLLIKAHVDDAAQVEGDRRNNKAKLRGRGGLG